MIKLMNKDTRCEWKICESETGMSDKSLNSNDEILTDDQMKCGVRELIFFAARSTKTVFHICYWILRINTCIKWVDCVWSNQSVNKTFQLVLLDLSSAFDRLIIKFSCPGYPHFMVSPAHHHHYHHHHHHHHHYHQLNVYFLSRLIKGLDGCFPTA